MTPNFNQYQPLTVHIGTWLFRRRSYTPLILFVLVFLPFRTAPTPISLLLVSFVFIGAELLRLWAVKHATGATRTRQDQRHPLCMTGPYAVIRNPLYVANVMIYGAAAWLFTHHAGIALMTSMVFWTQYVFVAAYEAHGCMGLFGMAYQEYNLRVPAWFPQWVAKWDWYRITALSDEPWSMAWSNERRSIMAIVITWCVFYVKWSVVG